MRAKEILDQPHHKPLSGHDLRINRYHIINPDAGELLISELRSKGYLWIFGMVLFGGMALLFSFMSYQFFNEDGSLAALLLPLGMALLGYLLAGLTIFGKFYSKQSWHFTSTELIETGTFGRKRIFSKAKVISIYIEVRQANVSAGSSNWFVCLKMRGDQNDFIRWSLAHINEEDVQSPGTMSSEAEQMTKLIAGFWTIPIHT